MKNYYYILGIKPTATSDEVKKAYRKLSLKFHPDTNEGDEFFTDRFKEIQEAYEVLVNDLARRNYDDLNNREASKGQGNSGANFSPHVEYFRADKSSFVYNEEVTFSWKTINTDKVTLKPFGLVQPIGQKTYKIKDFKSENLSFELIAENTNISRQVKSTLKLENKTYKELYLHFKDRIQEEEVRKAKMNSTAAQEQETANIDVEQTSTWSGDFTVLFLIIIAISAIFIFVIS